MKFGQNPKKQWRSSQELDSRFNPLHNRLNQLMILNHVWNRLVGNKSQFWVLKAVKEDTLYVKVKQAVARNELAGCRNQLIAELNKHFEKPWIHKIEIQ